MRAASRRASRRNAYYGECAADQRCREKASTGPQGPAWLIWARHIQDARSSKQHSTWRSTCESKQLNGEAALRGEGHLSTPSGCTPCRRAGTRCREPARAPSDSESGVWGGEGAPPCSNQLRSRPPTPPGGQCGPRQSRPCRVCALSAPHGRTHAAACAAANTPACTPAYAASAFCSVASITLSCCCLAHVARRLSSICFRSE